MEYGSLIKMFDDYMIEHGKRKLSLRTANEILKQQADEALFAIDLRQLLERGGLPHAFQTDTTPRLWYIPYSCPSEYQDNRKKFLATKTQLAHMEDVKISSAEPESS